jgi:tripartite-type tricarboxylate transporter receptor subunit TctC
MGGNEPTMKLSRKQVLHITVGAAVSTILARRALAQTYPARPVRLIVGVTAGGANDTVARLVAQSLTERLGSQVFVENRPGAGGTLASELVAKAAPDGYTLLFVTSANAIGASFNETPGFDFVRDIEPIASLVRGPLIMEVNPSFPTKTIPEFIAYAKAHPGAINMASAGIGNTTHVTGELFMMLTGTRLTHVPYRGGAPAVTDLLGGQVQVYFDGISGSLEYVRAGKLRALGVTTAARASVLPEVPSIGEFVPGYDASGWYGLGAPRGTPAVIVGQLNREINASLGDPKLKTRLADLGYATVAGSPGNSATSSPKKPRSGARYFGSRHESRSDSSL